MRSPRTTFARPRGPEMGSLYVARHGQATEPRDLRLPGADAALLEPGLAQARALAERLRTLGPVAVYASDAARAWQTAAVVAERCAVPLTALSALREIDFGAWGGRTYAEVIAADPTAADYFANPTASAPPEGERADEAADRVFGALRTLAESHREGVVVVGHTGSLRLALARALGMPLAAYWRLRLDHASLTILDWSENGVILQRLNDVSHLREHYSATKANA